jgi:hypothetical protein
MGTLEVAIEEKEKTHFATRATSILAPLSAVSSAKRHFNLRDADKELVHVRK